MRSARQGFDFASLHCWSGDGALNVDSASEVAGESFALITLGVPCEI